MDAIDEQMRARARSSVSKITKARARYYAERPRSLDAIFEGLSVAGPASLIEVGKALLTKERMSPRRHFGVGGEVPALNARAVVLLGRYQRARKRKTSHRTEPMDKDSLPEISGAGFSAHFYAAPRLSLVELDGATVIKIWTGRTAADLPTIQLFFHNRGDREIVRRAVEAFNAAIDG